MSEELTQHQKKVLLENAAKQFGKFGLIFTDVLLIGKRKKYSYKIAENSHTNTSNEIAWMLGVWNGKRHSFVESKDEVCSYWRNNHDLLQIAVEIGIVPSELAEKIVQGGKLSIEEAENIQSNVQQGKLLEHKMAPDITFEFPVGEEELNEGEMRQVIMNRYERNHEARERCIAIKGYRCAVCGIDFKEIYGEIGEGFIHVHHTTPISSIGKGYTIDVLNDLVPVCPNCHAMIHKKNPPFTVAEMNDILTHKKTTL